jgi:hypothetical protein
MSVAAPKTYTDPVSSFRALCLKYAEYIGMEKVSVTPFEDPSLPFFSVLPLEIQNRVIRAISADLEIFERVYCEGNRLRDGATHLWRFLHSLDLTPEADIFEKIAPGDLVEVYLLDESGQRQVFRNLCFFECLSFTIERLYSLDWGNNTSRSASVLNSLLESAMSMMTGKITQTISLNHIETHDVLELDSPGNYTLNVTMKFMSPVRQGRPLGVITILRPNYRTPVGLVGKKK